MGRPEKWWWGLVVPLALLVGVGMTTTVPVENDLHAKTAEIPWVVASVSGRDVRVDGTAPSEEARDQALSTLDGTPGIRSVRVGSVKVLATAKPYRFEARREGDMLTLVGFYPDADSHAAILATTKQSLPQARLDDRLTQAQGAPQGFVEAATFGLSQLASLSSGTVTLEDKSYSITGAAANAAGFARETARVKSLPGGLALQLAAISPPVQKPYRWSATRMGLIVTLDGFVPSEQERAALVKAVSEQLPGASVVDKQAVAAGQPTGFSAMASYALTQLARLSDARVALDDTHLAIKGIARDSDTLEASLAATKTLPVGFSLASAEITPPLQSPYRWAARRNGPVVTLSGFVPSRASREAIVSAAKAALPGTQVEDEMALAAGEPDQFEAAARFAFDQLARLASGFVSIEGTHYAVSGTAPSPEIADAVNAVAKVPPKGFSLASATVVAQPPADPVPEASLPAAPVPAEPSSPAQGASSQASGETIAKPLPPSDPKQVAACQKDFSSELGNSAIYFDTAKATFRQVSYATLDRLIEIARECPDVNVEIAAYTDNVGSPAANQELSRRRAEAVLDYLKQQIPVDRYRAVGYGAAEPVASNDTDEGRQKNRRVEFIVR